MVLSVQRMLALTLCVSTLAASEVAQSSALRTRRHLLGIHHTTKYAPEASQPTEGQEDQTKAKEEEEEAATKAKEAEEEAATKAKETEQEQQEKTKEKEQNDSADESHDSTDSHDSHDSIGSDSVDMELKENEELELNSSEDINLELENGPVDMNVDLESNEEMDYDGEGDQEIDLTSAESLDFSASAKLEGEEQMDTEIELEDGAVSLELEDDEDYNQDLDINDDEELDQVIDVPEGAKSIRLRVRKGHVDLDITKAATADVKEPKTETKKEEKAATPEKKQEQAATPEKKQEQAAAPEKKQDKTEVVAAASTEKAVSYAAEAKDWFQENGSKPIFLGGMIGAAVGLVGVAGVAIAKGRKRAPEKSVLAEDAIADAEAEADEDDASESDSDEDSDKDVEAGVTALAKEDVADVEEKKTSVVEGSV
ncbi:unnamed protein product [Hyaloperonospora brassicae]|uniref:RxLR effector candidate protein n=1 Tax=Hyaloperonospora brassicae TaxID=162125 RepID=A0AAV0SZ86_HYABA|nr:unnamed protein product [Hyaloperonospora brassicae]